jgi:glucose/arabinose dehydrogenase
VTGALSSPVYLTAPPGDTSRLFVVEQGGTIRIILHDTLLATPFLDVSADITSGGERGLLSMAFHPQYANNGRFYVYFTNPNGDIRIVRYLVSADSNVADSTSGDTVIAVPHPVNDNHNGGQLQFGPDGKLYAGLGDGGSGGDPDGNGQNKHALLGKLLRLDVDGASGYTIPANNPFVGDTSAAPEIWAWGLRNPWRYTFDRQSGDLYIGDVGQDKWEEVDYRPRSGLGALVNYGWSAYEGLTRYNPSRLNSRGALVMPVQVYSHSLGCSITGGYVYRGSSVPAAKGRYFYGDYCSGTLWSLRISGGKAVDNKRESTHIGSLSSFGQGSNGALYAVSLDGAIYRLS